ncbi:hypothetical protein ACIBVL_28605 [Streptomyces sp. NPDC049687]|uniref:hypothetical protein n=1 Tax=Streptomyces sp. NPDC049687 TaxID=3365596 RepID=UPI00379ED1F9
MTLALYVLDVPEFEPVVHTAEAAGMAVRHTGDYLELSSAADEVVLRRDPAAIRTAVWFATLTGGLDGRIVAFTADTLHLAKEAV